jgi:hypothetical protein
MDKNKLLDIVRADFGYLWQSKQRGNSIELITPFETSTSKFVSVFITIRANNFIVSDGGWLWKNFYGIHQFSIKDLTAITELRQKEHSIQTVANDSGDKYYFKKCADDKMLSAIIYDIANFIMNTVNIYSSQLSEKGEVEQQDRFGTTATKFITQINNNIKFNQSLDDQKSIKYNAVYNYNSNLVLIMYITGSTPYYFANGLRKAAVNFELSQKSKYSSFISHKLPLVDNEALGYHPDHETELFSYLEEKSECPIITWNERDKLIPILQN